MTKFRKHPFLTGVMIVALVMGLLFIFGDYSEYASDLFRIIGCFMLLSELMKYLINKDILKKKDFLNSITNIIVGVLLLVTRNMFTSMVMGLAIMAFPIYILFTAKNKKLAIHYTIPRLLLGLIIFFNAEVFDSFLFISFGIILILFSIYIVLVILLSKKEFNYHYYYQNEQQLKRDYIDAEFEERIIHEE